MLITKLGVSKRCEYGSERVGHVLRARQDCPRFVGKPNGFSGVTVVKRQYGG
jgi:hypothetical protein